MTTRTDSSARTARGLFVAVLGFAALVVVLAWFLVRRPVASTAMSSAAPDSVESARVDDQALADEDAPRTPLDPTVRPQEGVPPDTRESAGRPTPADAPVPATAMRRAEIDLRLFFVTPKGEKLVLPRAAITLAMEGGKQRFTEVVNDSSATIRPLPPGKCSVRVAAAGLWQRPLEIALVADTGVHSDDADPGSMTIREQKVVLWAAGWVAVVVRMPDGRPLRALAETFQAQPRRLFYRAFTASARLTPADARDDGAGEPVARFHPPSDYGYWDLPDGSIGALELLRDPPVWVELDVLGVPLARELVRAGDREVVFQLDAAAFEARCATVRLHVLDARSRSPLTEARVTLRADTAPHRRADQENVAPGGDGAVEFARVLPGKYELSVTRGNDLEQKRLELMPGQRLDLGDVLIEQNGSIALLVVDEKGEPVSAHIEIAPLEAGKNVEELYPPMLHRRADRHGRYDLPLPSKRSIVRARMEIGTSAGQPVSGARTANLLLDPAQLPPQPWKIVVREPVAVTFESASADATRVEAVDDLGVIDAWPKLDAHREVVRTLAPGRYRARFLGVDDAARAEIPFTVGAEPVTVRGP